MKRVRVKHEGEPKRPLSAYQLHNEKYFPIMKKKAEKATDIFRLLAQRWKNEASEEEKAKFVKKAAKAKKKYDVEIAEFRKKHPVEYKYVEKRKVKVKRDPNKPKRAPTSYNLYMKERRVKIAEKHPDMKSTEVIAQIGKEWREMSDEKKAPYVVLFSYSLTRITYLTHNSHPCHFLVSLTRNSTTRMLRKT